MPSQSKIPEHSYQQILEKQDVNYTVKNRTIYRNINLAVMLRNQNKLGNGGTQL